MHTFSNAWQDQSLRAEITSLRGKDLIKLAGPGGKIYGQDRINDFISLIYNRRQFVTLSSLRLMSDFLFLFFPSFPRCPSLGCPSLDMDIYKS